MNRDDTRSLKDVLRDFERTTDHADRLRDTRVVDFVETTLGSALMQHVDSVFLRGDVIFIRTEVAALRNELVFLKDTLIERIAERFGPTTVTDIRIV